MNFANGSYGITERMFYADQTREHDPHALPDHEVFLVDDEHRRIFGDDGLEFGWYWWPKQLGCLPDADPVGPFPTMALAMEDAREVYL